MASRKILSVGQCGYDHSQLSSMLAHRLNAQVDRADTAAEALDRLRDGDYSLVLVNRQLDLDGSPGVALIRTIKADDRTAAVPVMLVSNLPDAQQEAVQAGAHPGFGKADLHSAATLELLQATLDTPS